MAAVDGHGLTSAWFGETMAQTKRGFHLQAAQRPHAKG
jgi:hypothetical protein